MEDTNRLWAFNQHMEVGLGSRKQNIILHAFLYWLTQTMTFRGTNPHYGPLVFSHVFKGPFKNLFILSFYQKRPSLFFFLQLLLLLNTFKTTGSISHGLN